MKYDLFLSYSHLDRHIAEELEIKLTFTGLTCFLAEKSLTGGTEWVSEVRAALKDSERILILVTPRSINSKWVYMEVGAAWMEDKTVTPLLQFVDLSQLPEVMTKFQAKYIETEKQKLDFIHEMTGKAVKHDQINITMEFIVDQVRNAKSRMDQARFQPNLFIGCGRGGAICAGIFASLYGFHALKVIDCQFRGSGENRITDLDDSCLNKEHIIGRNILFIEWARQTGRTYELAKKRIWDFEPAALQSYAMFWTGKSNIPPDFFGISCDEIPLNPWSIW